MRATVMTTVLGPKAHGSMRRSQGSVCWRDVASATRWAGEMDGHGTAVTVCQNKTLRAARFQ